MFDPEESRKRHLNQPKQTFEEKVEQVNRSLSANAMTEREQEFNDRLIERTAAFLTKETEHLNRIRILEETLKDYLGRCPDCGGTGVCQVRIMRQGYDEESYEYFYYGDHTIFLFWKGLDI